MTCTEDKYLRPLSEERKRLNQKAKDADWEGHTQLSERLFAQVQTIDERLAAGETYEVLF